MKLLAYIKLSIKSLIRELPAFVLSYAMYPIILALLLGYIQKDDFTPQINQPIFSIEVVDEDNTDASKGLVSYLESEEISKILTVEKNNSEDLDYTLIIPKDYNMSLTGEKKIEFKIEASEDASTSKGNLLANLVDNYNKEISKALLIEKNIANSSLDKTEINSIISKAYSTNSIQFEKYSGEKTLSSYEYFSISFLGFIFILFIMAIINSDNMEKEIGLYSRIMSTSITKVQYFNFNLISNYLMMIVINSLYIFSFRLGGLSFSGSLSILWVIILLQSLVITLIGSLISTIFKKKYGVMVAQIYLMFHMIFGGMMGSPKNFSHIEVFQFFSKYKPDVLISNTYRNYLIYNDFSSISSYLLGMIIFSIIIYLVNIIAAKREWGLK